MNKNKQKIVNRRKKKEEGRKRLYYVPMKVYNNTLLENFCAQQVAQNLIHYTETRAFLPIKKC